jgi:hypothetical protein
MLLIVWLLTQTLGFILPSMSTVAKEEVLTWSSCDQNQLGNDGYDSGFLSCLVYDTEQPYGTTASLSDFVAIVQAAPAYDTAPVLTSRNTGSPRAQLYGRAQFFAAENLPKVGGGAALENLTPNQIARIQAIADKRGVEINVVGSRAGGTADAASDWDYIINGGNARARNSALYELPKNPNATKAGDMRPGSEILRGFQVDPNRPYITFTPSRH